MARLFYGWRMVGAATGMQFLQAALVNNAFGAYVAVLAEERGWSKTALSGAAALQQMEAALLGPALGWLLDRFGAQVFIRAGVFFLGGGLMLLSTVDSLAGGLSNTIAGRICNYFDLKGGGYVVDGACASSLLAIANACSALEAGDVDVVLAGGVDLSLDPFELAGFSKLGALAGEKMRVFDEHSSGFWPGEGCGFVVMLALLPMTSV